MKARVLLCASLFLALTTIASAQSTGAKASSSPDSTYNVMDYGAKGDGKTDDTAAFQTALDTVGRAGGGIVNAPTGNYMIKTHLSIPENVTLEGIWRTPPAYWSKYKGTTLLAVEGHGKPDGEPFIRLAGHNATIKGLAVYYPNQPVEGDAPVPYPWTVEALKIDNATIIDVTLVNPYQGVRLQNAGRHYVRNLHGQPLFKGMYIDCSLDASRVENVHFWPFYSMGRRLTKWVNGNAEAFVFGRCDFESVLDTFCFGYKTGYHFISTSGYGPYNFGSMADGPSQGSFVGIAADSSTNAVVVETCWPFGPLITNGQFVSIVGQHPTAVVVKDTNQGRISFQNCAVWGGSDRIASVGGKGSVTFNACSFMNWDKDKTGQYAISSHGGSLTVSNCHFMYSMGLGRAVEIGAGTNAAVVTGNLAQGAFTVSNKIGKRAQIGLNGGQ